VNAIPRVVISAPSSGHGKTAVSVGLLAAFAARGYRAAGFKIGPDHVDAAYLGLAAGQAGRAGQAGHAGHAGRNLDPRLVGAERIGPLFVHGAQGSDIAVVEGTMGLFDELAGRTGAESTTGSSGASIAESTAESTAHISGLLRAPVVLVIDVGAMGQSVAALVHGFRVYDELLWLGGVILNRVASSRHEQLLREALDDIGVPVLGALRRRALTELSELGAPLPPRRHGMVPVVHQSLDALRAVRRLGEVIGDAVDVERLMALARSAPQLTADAWSPELEVGPHLVPAPSPVGRKPRVGVGFAYAETAELLHAAGAEVVPFDPLRDERLPEGVDGLVVGGGLPEGYAEDLSFNAALRQAVAAKVRAGGAVVAEGTGLVWLCRELDGRPMCGVLDATARTSQMMVLGYREATSATESVLVPAGFRVVGHKMHHTLVTPRAGAAPAWTWAGGAPEGFVEPRVHASYLGVHWAGAPAMAARFVATLHRLAIPGPVIDGTTVEAA
jgi:cobyrinic acid a,c-diamide synthase